MKNQAAQRRLLKAVRPIAAARRDRLEEMKRGRSDFKRPDFVWHYMLLSFATMGRASGALGLIKNQENYGRITYSALSKLNPKKREKVVHEVCRLAKVRMPERKAQYILRCFDHVEQMGGVEAAKQKLLARRGAEAKIEFWQTFYGIGPKYARNIMMDVYHPEFRNHIALDVRIKSISKILGLNFTDAQYSDHEAFYLQVGRMAGLNGWEMDRLLFNFGDEVKNTLKSRA